MKRFTMLALVAGALSACTTAAITPPTSPIEMRWKGKSAGGFFARYAPPYSDVTTSSQTVYSWRGGFKRIKLQGGATANVSCSAQITVDTQYRITDIHITGDRPGAKGPSYCTELLTEE
jgi:hypothetical protein